LSRNLDAVTNADRLVVTVLLEENLAHSWVGKVLALDHRENESPVT
jgi:hypothetical protein